MYADVVIVTGGCGYIGAHLCERLISKELEVVSIDNLSGNVRFLLPDSYTANPKFHKFDFDLRDFSIYLPSLREIVKGKSVAVIHLAADKNVTCSLGRLNDAQEYNSQLTKAALCLAGELTSTRFIFASTAAVYADSTTPTNESSKLDPISPYAFGKLEDERSVHCWGAERVSRSVINLRFFNPVGCSQAVVPGKGARTPDSLFDILSKRSLSSFATIPFSIHGGDWPTPDGSPMRDFLHIEDLIRAMLLALSYHDLPEILNVGSNEGMTVLQVLREFSRFSKTEILFEFGVRVEGRLGISVADSRLIQSFGWRNTNSLHDMVSSHVAMMKQCLDVQ